MINRKLTEYVSPFITRDSESSEDTLYDGQIILNDNITVDTATTSPGSATTATAATAATTAKTDTSPRSARSATSKNTYAREHAKYMKKRLLDTIILEKVKQRYFRYMLEKQILDIKIKDTEEYIAESEKAIRERNSILQPPAEAVEAAEEPPL